ncbi:MAG: NAD(P)H-hydrate epimerase/ ADP-dependent (S)-NAD(P)H-hydrate dehydratase [Nitrospira sp.]|jgi:NAD(P)H-hydrate epimerase|nr:MAG: NAD(P)H-hydrate epimerase/ ADP-dependent (S)-NAD(P)H-hydrate dehydratase [Nitrospira sp.]
MIPIVTGDQMRTLDRRTITEARVPSLTLMERAGAGVVAHLEQRYGPLAGKSFAVVCGKGNNGGDGFVIGRLLRREKARVQVLLLSSPTGLSRDARTMYQRFQRAAGQSAVIRPTDAEGLRRRLAASDVIVDAMLGTGLSTAVTGLYRDAIEAINATVRPTVAVDLPSGLHADTGAVLGAAVQADLTVTFGLPKVGLYTGFGIDCAGTVRLVDIGIPAAFIEAIDRRLLLLTGAAAHATLPRRRPCSHKGTYGHVGIIAGSVGKTGAAAMAALAALRVGTGLVTVAVPSSVNDVLEVKLLEAMTFPMPETKARTFARSGLDRLLAFTGSRDAVAIGPGLTTHPETVDLVQEFVKCIDRPCVLDADALNALAGKASLLTECKRPPIITPHPGEMARLEADATTQSVNQDRIGTATRFARERGVFVILKGARTVIARPDGLAAVCPTGNPGMATAGTGDVLTGMVGGLLAQGLSQWDAACAATYFHGLAGDLAANRLGQIGMIARDLIQHIPYALASDTQA